MASFEAGETLERQSEEIYLFSCISVDLCLVP